MHSFLCMQSPLYIRMQMLAPTACWSKYIYFQQHTEHELTSSLAWPSGFHLAYNHPPTAAAPRVTTKGVYIRVNTKREKRDKSKYKCCSWLGSYRHSQGHHLHSCSHAYSHSSNTTSTSSTLNKVCPLQGLRSSSKERVIEIIIPYQLKIPT